MKKLLNIRLPLLFACILVFGICLGFILFKNDIRLIWIIAVVPIAAVVLIFLCLLSKKSYAITVLICAVLFISGTVNCYMRLENFSSAKLTDGEINTVTATVYEKGENAYGEYIILTNARTDGVKIDGKIRASLSGAYGDFCDAGYKVKFTAKINNKELFEYGKLNYYAEENVKYTCTVNGGLEAKRGFSLFGNVRSAMRKALYDNLDKDTAAVAYAMITGNTQGVDEGTTESFRYGGIAHIFAVSGLHIGIVYGVFSFLFKKLRINAFAAFALCLAPVIFYAGVCGFTLSSVRALIMCAVSAAAKLVHKKHDGLNALSVAVILILLITPLSLFFVGFQLSVCAVAAIFILKLPKRLPRFLRIPLAAQAGTLPVLLVNFGYLSGSGLLLNILVLPLLSVIFVITFVCTILCTVLPFIASIVLPYTLLPLKAVISFLIGAGFEKAIISGFGAGVFVPVYYLGLIVISDKLNIKLLYRLSAAACAVLFLTVYVILRSVYPFNGFYVTVSGYHGGGCVILKSHGENVLIVTEHIDETRLNIILNNGYASHLTAVIFVGSENCIPVADGSFGCDTYVYGGYIDLAPYTDLIYADNFSVGSIDFVYGDGYSLLAHCNSVEIAVCNGKDVPFESCNLLITDCAESACKSGITVGFNEQSIEYNVYRCGDFNFTVKDGILKMK